MSNVSQFKVYFYSELNVKQVSLAGYLTMLSVLRLYRADDKVCNECGAVSGIRTDRSKRKTQRKLAPV
jgi:hypothetical protein